MREDTFRKWQYVFGKLYSDKTATVKCPECRSGILLIEDSPTDKITGRVNRSMTCENCGESQTISAITRLCDIIKIVASFHIGSEKQGKYAYFICDIGPH